MSGHQKARPLTSGDDARQATRELHEAMKDARALLREIHAEKQKMMEIRNTAVAEFTDLVRSMEAHLKEQDKVFVAAVMKKIAEIGEKQIELLGCSSPDELIQRISSQVVDLISPGIIKETLEALPDIVADELARVLDLKPTINAAKHGNVTVEIRRYGRKQTG